MAVTGCYACMKYLVIMFDLLFWLAGIGVLAVSIWLYVSSALYLSSEDNTVIYILMAAGAAMILVGFLGCCGALFESPCMLGTFFVFLLVIFAAQVTGGVWAWIHKTQVKETIKLQLTKMVKEDYEVLDSVTKSVDAMQHDLGCCGAQSPGDWSVSRYNNKDRKSIEIGVIGNNSTYYNVPETCCKIIDDTDCQKYRKVKFAGALFDGIHKEGCVPKLQRYLEDHLIVAVGVGIGVGIVQILGLIFSMALCCAIRGEAGSLMKA